MRAMIDSVKVRALRLKAGLTTAEAAARAKMEHTQSWQRYELKDRSITATTLRRIARALRVPADSLLKKGAK